MLRKWLEENLGHSSSGNLDVTVNNSKLISQAIKYTLNVYMCVYSYAYSLVYAANHINK